MDENKAPHISLSDKERFPLLDDLSFLMELRQEEFAPKFNFKSGDRLTETHLEDLVSYRTTFNRREKVGSHVFEWLESYVSNCILNVPAYKKRPSDFSLQPTVSKSDLQERPWDFVSDQADLNELLVYQTSGTTGPPMDVNFSPATQSAFIPQLEAVLNDFNVKFSYSPKRVAIALICDQASTLTYASLSTYLNGSGILKLNLNSNDWDVESDRLNYLEKHNPEVITGDPFSFLSLKSLKPAISPKALVSSATKLLPSVKKELEDFFKCPVIDVYSMTECRMLAYKVGDDYKTIRPDLYFEVFHRSKDVKLEDNQVGELVVSGGNNPFINLIRYRTGDFCRIKTVNGIQYLVDLEARNPVVFKTEVGKEISSVNVSRVLAEFSLVSYTLHQSDLLKLQLTAWTDDDVKDELLTALLDLFGSKVSIDVALEPLCSLDPSVKKINYTSVL